MNMDGPIFDIPVLHTNDEGNRPIILAMDWGRLDSQLADGLAVAGRGYHTSPGCIRGCSSEHELAGRKTILALRSWHLFAYVPQSTQGRYACAGGGVCDVGCLSVV